LESVITRLRTTLGMPMTQTTSPVGTADPTSNTHTLILKTIAETRAASRAARRSGKRIGLVPTMGALHEGHLSLVRAAKAQTDFVIVSIFINPLQFGPKEDLSKYPRTFERDCALLGEQGVDVIFSPAVDEMYPGGSVTYVTVEDLSGRLDGVSRPGHFRGVTTVVSKLFHIAEPDKAFFGQKDAAQVAILKRMVGNLDTPVEIVVGPIIREPDGLAMSSRNAYLDSGQRKQGLVLSCSLRRMEALYEAGERDARKLISAGEEVFREEPSVRIDYVSIVGPDSLESVNQATRGSLVAVAAYVGTTRLIDNLILG
jgi:pantoate--beta-alanine ligase